MAKLELHFDVLEFNGYFAKKEFEKAVAIYKNDFCQFYLDHSRSEGELISWIEEGQKEFKKKLSQAIIGLTKSCFLKNDIKVASDHAERVSECLGLDSLFTYVPEDQDTDSHFEVYHSLFLLGGKKSCIDKLGQYVQDLEVTTSNFPKDESSAMKFLESQWGQPNPSGGKSLSSSQDFSVILERITDLLEMEDSRSMRNAISRVILKEFKEKKESSKEIAEYLVDSHTINKKKANELINSPLSLAIKDSQLLKEVQTDFEKMRTRQAFTNLLGWVTHFALPNEDISKYILDLESEGIVVIPLEEAINVEIFSAKATGRIAIFDRINPNEYSAIGGKEAVYLKANSFAGEELQSKSLYILISLWKSINRDKELDDVKAEEDYKKWSSLGFKEENKNIPKFVRDLRARIKNKKEAREAYPYIISQISSLPEEDFFVVCKELRQRIPFLDSMGFGVGDDDEFSSVFEEDIRESVSGFFEILEGAFPKK